MTFRKDLKDTTDALNAKLTLLMGDMRRINKRISDGLADEIERGFQSGAGNLNDERARIWDSIKETQAAVAAIEDEKRVLLGEAGLSPAEVPFPLSELPNTAEELHLRLHSIREPRRSELTEKLIAAGMIAPRRKSISVWGLS